MNPPYRKANTVFLWEICSEIPIHLANIDLYLYKLWVIINFSLITSDALKIEPTTQFGSIFDASDVSE